jgi:AAA domain-containing protein
MSTQISTPRSDVSTAVQWPVGLSPKGYADLADRAEADPAVRLELATQWHASATAGLDAADLEDLGDAYTLEGMERRVIERLRSMEATARRSFALRNRMMHVRGINFKINEPEDPAAEDRVWWSFTCHSCRGEVALIDWTPEEASMDLFGYADLRHVQVLDGMKCSYYKDAQRTESGSLGAILAEKLGITFAAGTDWELVRSQRKRAGEIRWLVPGVMEAGKMAALFGPAKAGKSLLALQWAVEAAQAGTRVVYLDEENDPNEVDARLESMGVNLLALSSLTYHSFTNWCVDTEEGAEAILAACEGAELVVFDSWNKFFRSGDQNGSGPMLEAYRLTIKPLRRAGAGVLRLDHTGHEEAKRPAGSHVKLGDVDHNWMMRAKRADRGQPVHITLTHTENRTNRGEDMIRLVRQVEPRLWHVQPGAVAPESVEDVAAQESTEDARVLAVAEALDEVSAPLDWTVRQCMTALQAVGKGCRRELIGPAQRHRNRHAPAAPAAA